MRLAAMSTPDTELALLESIQRRVLWLATYMVHHANHARPNPDGTKIGGHQASSSSIVTLMTALYFKALKPGEVVAVKAHAAPVFYAIEYLRGRLTVDQLKSLRSFGGLQAYPSRRKNPGVVELSTGSMGLAAARAVHRHGGGRRAGRGQRVGVAAGGGRRRAGRPALDRGPEPPEPGPHRAGLAAGSAQGVVQRCRLARDRAALGIEASRPVRAARGRAPPRAARDDGQCRVPRAAAVARRRRENGPREIGRWRDRSGPRRAPRGDPGRLASRAGRRRG